MRHLLLLVLMPLVACAPDPWADKQVEMAVPTALQGPLQNPEKVTLYTIASMYDVNEKEALTIEEFDALPKLGKFAVLGSQVVTTDEGDALISSFVTAVRNGERASVKCFWPHHAIRVEGAGQTVEIVICFACSNYRVMPDGGYNNVRMSDEVGMKEVWRGIVSKYGLKDLSKAGS